MLTQSLMYYIPPIIVILQTHTHKQLHTFTQIYNYVCIMYYVCKQYSHGDKPIYAGSLRMQEETSMESQWEIISGVWVENWELMAGIFLNLQIILQYMKYVCQVFSWNNSLYSLSVIYLKLYLVETPQQFLNFPKSQSTRILIECYKPHKGRTHTQ